MKSRHAAALALIVLASCGPGMATINDANERAERAAERAQAAQLRAERSAALAADAVERTKSADYSVYPGDGAAAFGEGSSEWWAMRAQDVVTRMCATCDSCHVLTGAARERYDLYQAIWYEACTGHPWPYPLKGLSK
jgi:hypothetical protein